MPVPVRVLLATFLFSGGLLAEVIRIQGSDVLGAKLVPKLAEAFKAAGNPEVRFEIVAEGSPSGFQLLANGAADLGMSSRKITDQERTLCETRGVTLEEHRICHDMLCVIVHKDSSVAELTKNQVAGLFTGEIQNWSGVGGSPGPVAIYTRNTASESYRVWRHLAMGGRDYGRASVKLASGESVTQQVAKDRNGISYVGLASSKTPGIKVLPIDGVEPIGKNAEKYAFARPCYIYAPDKPTVQAAAFMAFIEQPEGQEVVRKVGFIPVKDLK
ncbi:MAG: PstS family phosphate ABC transporter substrate-binding protein [Verrucomicrobia bacterium]|nr:PstS family phosphate ABC transporter substrate-binding protein [Verrucomicrobiota bacterium]